MTITINNKAIEAHEGETLIEVAHRSGIDIPSLCYAKDFKHKSSCMVCAVKDCKSRNIIPSCTTLPVEGMQIDTESEEVTMTRSLSLELLLSDHRADCVAPCSMVCPSGLDVEKMLSYYDAGQYREALETLSAVFSLPEIACDTCKTPCEKACRRGSVDDPVEIRSIIRKLTSTQMDTFEEKAANGFTKDQNAFYSRLGRFTYQEKEYLKKTTDAPSRCLHCTCSGKDKCRLRLLSSQAGIRRSRYEASSASTIEKIPINDLWFEPAKCIRCGLCVYNSENGFAFKNRGFKMNVVLPEENKNNIPENLAELCPTGAIFRSLMIILIAILSFACTQSASNRETAGEKNWTLFRGDPGLSGYSDVGITEKPTLLWSYKSDSRTTSSPVIFNQTVYWSDKRGRIYGINTEGKQVFDFDFATAIEASPMISDSMLFIGRIDGFMSALSLTSKDTLWNFETQGQISASPNIGVFEGKNAIVFGSYDNFLYCVDKKNGKEISRFESGYYINGAVAVKDNYFVSGGCDAWLKVIDGETGTTTDSLELETYIPASPAIVGNDCYIADHSGNIYAMVLNKGKITNFRKMIAATDDSGTFVSVPAVSSTTLYIISDDRHLYAIDRKTGNIRWKYLQKGGSGESSPLVCRDKVISCTKSGIVSVLKADSGEWLWEYDTGEQITSSPAVIKDHFYILTVKGTLFCFGEE
jgi:outer membrane protein assembly factor BamB/ferredoxin